MTQLTIKEAAEIKNVRVGTVYGWISAGIIDRPITKEQLDAIRSKRRGVKLSEATIELVKSADLSCLTEHQRFVIRQHYLKDKTLQDIADELEISRAAVKSAEDRALKNLMAKKISSA